MIQVLVNPITITKFEVAEEPCELGNFKVIRMYDEFDKLVGYFRIELLRRGRNPELLVKLNSEIGYHSFALDVKVELNKEEQKRVLQCELDYCLGELNVFVDWNTVSRTWKRELI